MKKTWAEEEMERLMEKKAKGETWTQDDWESYCYIENITAESRWLDSLE